VIEIIFILAALALVTGGRWATGRQPAWVVSVAGGWVVIDGVAHEIVPQSGKAPEGWSAIIADDRGNITLRKAKR